MSRNYAFTGLMSKQPEHDCVRAWFAPFMEGYT